MAFWNQDKSAPRRRALIEKIEYDGPNDILVWKHPNEDFNNNTKLEVGPAQLAYFISEGEVLQRFTSGTYTLNTKNYPFLRSLMGLATGGAMLFSCAVYYVNHVVSMGIDWGTDTPISVIDPVYNVPVDIRSYGDFSLQVENGQMLLEQLVGQNRSLSQREIQAFFANMMATCVRGVISGMMMERKLSPIGIDAYLPEMSAAALKKLSPIFAQYGMRLNHFTIASISAPELDVIKQKARELQRHRMETDVVAEDTRKLGGAEVDVHRALRNQPVQGGPAPKESFEERAKKVKFLYESRMITKEQYQEKIAQLMQDI